MDRTFWLIKQKDRIEEDSVSTELQISMGEFQNNHTVCIIQENMPYNKKTQQMIFLTSKTKTQTSFRTVLSKLI